MVGRQFLVTAQTEMGVYQRLIKAFDEQDARDQMLAYLKSEGISHHDVSIQPF
jgi:beta-lactamase superfamily II metal-dependent hydrolase